MPTLEYFARGINRKDSVEIQPQVHDSRLGVCKPLGNLTHERSATKPAEGPSASADLVGWPSGKERAILIRLLVNADYDWASDVSGHTSRPTRGEQDLPDHFSQIPQKPKYFTD